LFITTTPSISSYSIHHRMSLSNGAHDHSNHGLNNVSTSHAVRTDEIGSTQPHLTSADVIQLEHEYGAHKWVIFSFSGSVSFPIRRESVAQGTGQTAGQLTFGLLVAHICSCAISFFSYHPLPVVFDSAKGAK
jgi:hypothetical protein